MGVCVQTRLHAQVQALCGEGGAFSRNPASLASVKGRGWAWEPRLWSSKLQGEWGLWGHTSCTH